MSTPREAVAAITERRGSYVLMPRRAALEVPLSRAARLTLLYIYGRRDQQTGYASVSFRELRSYIGGRAGQLAGYSLVSAAIQECYAAEQLAWYEGRQRRSHVYVLPDSSHFWEVRALQQEAAARRQAWEASVALATSTYTYTVAYVTGEQAAAPFAEGNDQ